MGGTVAFIYGMALFGSTYLVPVFMQEALHLPPSQAGAVLLPAGLVLALTIPLAGRLADRVAGQPHGEPRPRAARGLVLPHARRRTDDRARADHALGGDRPARPRPHHAVAQPRLDAGRAEYAHRAGLEHDQLPAPARRRGRHRPGRQRPRVAPARARGARRSPPIHETFALVGAITACAIVAAWRIGPGQRADRSPSTIARPHEPRPRSSSRALRRRSSSAPARRAAPRRSCWRAPAATSSSSTRRRSRATRCAATASSPTPTAPSNASACSTR